MLGWLGQVLAWAVILLACAALALGVVIPRLGGATPYTILTGSMQPKYPPGTLVVIKPVDPAALAVGDVATYQLHSGDPTVVTHRIVAVSQNMKGEYLFQFRGDANNVADDKWVMPIQIKGRLWYAVPWLGWTNKYIHGTTHRWVVDAVVVVLLGYALVMFGGSLRDRRKAMASDGGKRRARSGSREERQEVGT
jgi:signal peptidase